MARPHLEPRPDREVFELPLEVRPEHIDENGHVNNVVYVAWLQEAGTAHWNARSTPEDRAKWSWVGTRHEIDYFRPLLPDAAGVRARTWVGEPHGSRFSRYVRIEDGDGRLCAQGLTEWALVDARTMRPQRIPTHILPAFSRPAGEDGGGASGAAGAS